jgi:predicted DNA-binding transcriptional regulator YafY
VRADRLVSLVLLLQARGRVSAAALAAELRVSVRTVYRDLAALSVSGVPILTESGPNGGCRLLEGYAFPLRGLTSDEAAALLLPGVPAALAELGLGGPLTTAHRKISITSVGPALPPIVHLDMPKWFAAKEAVPHLRTLASALRERRRLRIRYRDQEVPRVLDPLGLVNKAGLWYLVAVRADADRDGGRGPAEFRAPAESRVPAVFRAPAESRVPAVFRAGRITSASVLAEPAVRDEGFDLASFWARWSAEFETSRPSCEVRVRASPTALDAFPEIFGDGARAVLAAAGPLDLDGFREVTLSFDHELAAAHRLAGFGGHVEVLSPASVRSDVIATGREILKRYGASGALPLIESWVKSARA